MAKQLQLLTNYKATFRIPKQLHRQVKLQAVEENRDMSVLVAEALEQYLVHRKSRKSDG